MEPAVLMGTIIGVYLNITFPSYLIVITLVCILSLSAYRTLKKGIALYKVEKEAANSPLEGSENKPLIETSGASIQSINNTDDESQERAELMQLEKKASTN